jgi:hypothetical protein
MNNRTMGERDELWEASLQALANQFEYPPTPDLVPRLSGRNALGTTSASSRPIRQRPFTQRKARLAAAFLIVLLAFAGLMSVPPVRAAVLEFFQIGVVRIFPATVTPTLSPTMLSTTPTESGNAAGETALSVTVTATTPQRTETPPASPTSAPASLSSLLDLAGQTTLESAQADVGFPLKLPVYPDDLGPPDQIFLQIQDGEVVILVWLESDHPDRVRLALYEIGPDAYIEKIAPQIIQETQVEGRPAFWTTGPYFLKMTNGDTELNRLVQGHVLIWTDGEVTYRLETDLPLAEARLIAASLK